MTALEISYRRLLACYPRAYRREYEEELLGVLLADADHGRRRPRAGDAADLLAGALRIRLRGLLGRTSRSHWRDAFAVAGTAMAVLMLAWMLPNLIYNGMALAGGQYTGFAGGLVGGEQTRSAGGLAISSFNVFAGAVAVGVPLMSVVMAVGVVRGYRVLAAVSAWAAVAGTAYGVAQHVPVSPGNDASAPLSVIIALFAAVCLSVPNQPCRGIELIQRRGRTGWMLAVAAGLVLAIGPWVVSGVPPEPPLTAVLPALYGYGAGIAVWSPVGRRAMLLLAVPLYALIEVSWLTPAIVFGMLGPFDLLVVAIAVTAFCTAMLHSRRPHPGGQRLGSSQPS